MLSVTFFTAKQLVNRKLKNKIPELLQKTSSGSWNSPGIFVIPTFYFYEIYFLSLHFVYIYAAISSTSHSLTEVPE